MNLHRVDLISLSLFTRVARTGSISKGAELCHLAVGAASKRVSDLEAAVGVPLLERHSRGATLTAAGEALQLHALRILGNVDQLVADLSDHAQGVLGVVRLWANTSAVTQFLPCDLAAFAAAHAGIRIELNESDSHDAVLAVAEGRADLGIVAEHTPALGLHVVPYRSDRLVLVVGADHPLAGRERLAFAEAVPYDFVSLSEGTSLAHLLAQVSSHLGKPLRIRIRVRSFDAMCQMVAAGLGIAVMPEGAARALVAALGLHQLELVDDWTFRRLLLGMRDPGALTRPASLLVDHFMQMPLVHARR